ncbi:MAG: glycine cleavage system protein GcvH [Acidobacteriota bacterium]|nr:glycine cleavage system protein GcvH [Acidobacteriota bacterium]
MYPEDLKYSKDHEWVRVEGEEWVFGITDFAQSELGEVVFVELPEVGDSFAAGDEVGTIESVKAVAEVYAPVGGDIVAINELLADAPEKVNEDPHGAGWLARVRPASTADLEQLMDAAAYQELIADG